MTGTITVESKAEQESFLPLVRLRLGRDEAVAIESAERFRYGPFRLSVDAMDFPCIQVQHARLAPSRKAADALQIVCRSRSGKETVSNGQVFRFNVTIAFEHSEMHIST